MRPSVQAPAAVVMVRPHHFTVNTQTAQDNAFQAQMDVQGSDLSRRAYDEHTAAMAELERRGVRVHVFEGSDAATPDCVFPNNWFSTHAGGHVAIYPMKAANRRLERRADVIELLKAKYRVQDVIDYSGLEPDRLYLEGTGAMVLDHIDRVAYAVASDRTNPIALERFCTHFNFEPMVFPAADSRGVNIYHTNVLMCIGTDYALLGADMITDHARREEVITRLQDSGRDVIALTEAQIAKFAGNAIELQGRDGRLLALSQTAYDALDPSQIALIAQSATLVPLSIPTIEMAGGSVRCTIAGIHLAPRR
ncbi:amidinotransferase (plasmid) [Loktanella salsilacus]|uniref:citrulline utilization hydrolase CtlX n=1 Tax=Loktanella salsilacus TaxID=195913 RepID=UPI0020B880BF|nr:arginine deiminase-related protein [Loktanella salsilacus]UTH50236.1 amidinotransferase [Loktanella salsilacus]